jgi:hypothetical protein
VHKFKQQSNEHLIEFIYFGIAGIIGIENGPQRFIRFQFGADALDIHLVIFSQVDLGRGSGWRNYCTFERRLTGRVNNKRRFISFSEKKIGNLLIILLFKS